MINITLDWYSYFKSFCEAHGEPVPYKKRLLFKDGWQYSATDYSGPEYRPSGDVDDLVFQYWTIRKRVLTEQAMELRGRINTLYELQLTRERPLLCRVSRGFDEQGRQSTDVEAVDLQPMVSRLEWVIEEVKECNSKLKELSDGVEARGSQAGDRDDSSEYQGSQHRLDTESGRVG